MDSLVKSVLGEQEPKETILEEAQRITHEERQRDYSSPEISFEHVASIASAITRKQLTARDICNIFLAAKISREQTKHKRDNLVDIAGYAWCLSRIAGDEHP